MPHVGMLALTLHAHLPFIRHPEEPDCLEERWLFEAITEAYLPLLERLQRLGNDRVPFRLTVSFSPTLLAMLEDDVLQDRYVSHLDRMIELSAKEIERTRWLPPFHRLALFYHHRFTSAKHFYVEGLQRDLIQAFRELIDRGLLEPLGACATHGYLPLMRSDAAVRAQIHVGMQACERAFGRRPVGFWLPACGYQPGHDVLLKACGVRYFLTDAQAILLGSPRPKYGVYAPVVCPSGVAAFGRDRDSSAQIGNGREGYPGHRDYREFHRDIGFDLEHDYLRPYLGADEERLYTGLKYYRPAGPDGAQHPYDPDRALEQSARHAEQFLAAREQQIQFISPLIDRTPLVVSPYDAELFGHWWFEGPDWLEFVIRKAHAHHPALQLVTPSDYLQRYPVNQPVEPALSSWGAGGYSDVWLNRSNDWIYRHLHKMSERMTKAATQPRPDRLRVRLLNQMARELLLAQSSDWAFILKTQTHTAYAYRRLQDHLARFTRLSEAVDQRAVDERWLADVENKDNLFPFLDYRLYAA